MKSVILCFATHNHQPLGNFDHVIEGAYERSYRPFFELAEKYPVRFATHFSGILLNWIETKHPESVARMRRMVQRGQLEIISGGFYEPILSVIPPDDQQAQIAMLSEKIRSSFGYDPHGMWLAERVWEQPLASALHDAGMRYVLLDDTHFLYAGLFEDDLNGYYLTEDRGKTLAVFPISKALRYTIPFAPVDETIRVLREAASEDGQNIVCFADDGEKFGVWPGTYGSVYEEGWLVEFFQKLGENSNWIDMLHPAEVLKRLKPKGRIYLQNASYAEMMQWALPTARANQRYENFLRKLDEDKAQWQQYLPFVRGGYWRNFFTKYPETNHLHKHMLRTSARVRSLSNSGMDMTEARTALLSAQCNDPYWHGVFGGAYLPNLRHANYSALVRADRVLDDLEISSGIRCEITDFDCDGSDELILESKIFSIYVKPSMGGMIAELDFKPRDFNSTNIFSRQEESYHKNIGKAKGSSADTGGSKSIHDLVQTKEANLERLLHYDLYRHGSMIEHFLEPGATTDDLKSNQYVELGDFVCSSFDWGYNEAGMLRLCRTGRVRTKGNREAQIRLEKTLVFETTGNEIKVVYSLKNESRAELRLRFASEWAFNLLAGSAHDRYYESGGLKLAKPEMNSAGTLARPDNIRLVDEYLKLAIDLRPDGAHEILRFPIETVSLSEAGFERVFQGSIIMPVWDVYLKPDSEWTTGVSVTFENLAR
jgi:alpha-amylase